MKARFIVYASIVAAVAGLSWWFAMNTYWAEEIEPGEIKGEALRNPFYALQRFSEAVGARTEVRRSLGTLPPADAVIYLSMWHWDLLAERREALERWVAEGGRLVVDQTLAGGEEQLERWSGIKRAPCECDDEDDKEPFPLPAPPVPAATPELCSKLQVQGNRVYGGGRAEYEVCNAFMQGQLASTRALSWSMKNERGMQAARVEIGRGSFTLFNGIAFQNHEVGTADHAALFAALAQLRRGDTVYFITDDQSESLLRLMWRLGAPSIVLAAALIALALWRGSARFGPLAASPDPARRSLGEQILGTGRFTMRFGGGRALHAATVRALFEAGSRRIVSFEGLPGPERIAALAKAGRVDLDALTQAINYSGPRRAGELRNTLALLESARRMIL
jgi:hypothetical protein